MERKGWVKFHRKLLESAVFGNEKALKVWVWCLLKASHKDHEVLIGRQKLVIHKGQFVMGSERAVDELSLAKATIWYWLKFLEKEGQVVLKKTNKYTVVTLVNWTEYQDDLDTDETPKERQVGTYKNEKNEKKIVALEDEPRKVLVSDSDEERPKKLPKDEKALSLCRWAEQRRGFVFTSIPAQLGAIGRAKTAGISPTRLKERWGELEGETWRNGFDWVDVVKSFDKRA